MTTTTKIDTVKAFREFQQALRAQHDPSQIVISVCGSTGCIASKSPELVAAFHEELRKHGRDDVPVKTTGCHGFCERGPLVVILPQDIFYQKVKPKDVPEIIEQTVGDGKIIERLLYHDPSTKERCTVESEVPFYAKQQRIVFRHSGRIDPTSIEDYIVADGYTGLAKVFGEMSPEQVIDEVKRS